jgi:hypothetical protein
MRSEGELPVCYRATGGTPIIVHTTIRQKEGAEGIRLVETPSKQEMRVQLLDYYRKVHEH